jgi:hypothetical protein
MLLLAPLDTGAPSRVKHTSLITAVLPDATAPDPITVKGPERTWPDVGAVKDTVGTAIFTVTDLLATVLSLPVESITLIVKVWVPLVQLVASKLQPKTIEPDWL